MRLTGFVDARNGVSIETRQRGVRVDTDVYIPVVSLATPEAPVAVLVRHGTFDGARHELRRKSDSRRARSVDSSASRRRARASSSARG